MAQVNMYLDSQGWWPFQNHKKMHTIDCIQEIGAAIQESYLCPQQVYISLPPLRVSSQPLGGLLERPCVSLCAYRLQVFSSRYRIKGFFCTRLFQISNNPTQIRCMLQYFFPFFKCFPVSLSSGVFWISWECVMQFFDVIYMNWNPKLFKYRFSLHS